MTGPHFANVNRSRASASVADHQQRIQQRADILQRVGVHHQQVRLEAGGDLADLLIETQHLGIGDGRRLQRLQRRHAGVHEHADFARDARDAVRAIAGIRSRHDLHARA